MLLVESRKLHYKILEIMYTFNSTEYEKIIKFVEAILNITEDMFIEENISNTIDTVFGKNTKHYDLLIMFGFGIIYTFSKDLYYTFQIDLSEVTNVKFEYIDIKNGICYLTIKRRKYD